MRRNNSIKFLDISLQRRLISALRRHGIAHRLGKGGVVYYPRTAEREVSDRVLSAIRTSVFPQWQLLTCPNDWIERYRAYMEAHNIPYREEIEGRRFWFLLPRKYRPHRWSGL